MELEAIQDGCISMISSPRAMRFTSPHIPAWSLNATRMARLHDRHGGLLYGFSRSLSVATGAGRGVFDGGWLAAELAATCPERVEKLALVNAVGLKVEGAEVADIFLLSPRS